MDKYIGRLLDNRYEILEVIGTGGMAVVYKARCHRLNRLVAIKILKNDYLGDEDFRRRFRAESQAVAMLSHPNIVSVYDVSTSVSLEADYIVMELIEGITLKQYMEKKGVLNWKEALHFASQIAKALEHAHSRGIVHRDIKPENILIKDGILKISDFGLSKYSKDATRTLTFKGYGTAGYVAPEAWGNDKNTIQMDIYSMGIVFFEIATLQYPYRIAANSDNMDYRDAHFFGVAKNPGQINADLPQKSKNID